MHPDLLSLTHLIWVGDFFCLGKIALLDGAVKGVDGWRLVKFFENGHPARFKLAS